MPLLRAASPVLTLENNLMPSPANVGSSQPLLFSADNKIFLSWTDSLGKTQSAQLDPAQRTWIPCKSTPPLPPSVSSDLTTKQNSGRSAKAWFDPSPKDPSIQVSVQPSPRDPFLMPTRVEDSRPCGKPDLLLLKDGTVFVSWPEHYNQNEIALWLRRISPGGSLSVPALLAVLPEGHLEPHLALVKDFDDQPAQVLLAYAQGEDETAQIIVRWLTIAPATNEARHNPCVACPDPDESARGYALHGHVISFSAKDATIVVEHSEIANVLPAGTTTFKIDPALLKAATTRAELFARVEKRDSHWWLFAPSWVVRAKL